MGGRGEPRERLAVSAVPWRRHPAGLDPQIRAIIDELPEIERARRVPEWRDPGGGDVGWI